MPGGVLDRQGRGVDLTPIVGRDQVGQRGPDLFEGSPQPAGPPVELAAVRQAGERPGMVTANLGQEPGLAATVAQMPDQHDRDDLGVAATGHGSGPGRDHHLPGGDQAIGQGAAVDELRVR